MNVHICVFYFLLLLIKKVYDKRGGGTLSLETTVIFEMINFINKRNGLVYSAIWFVVITNLTPLSFKSSVGRWERVAGRRGGKGRVTRSVTSPESPFKDTTSTKWNTSWKIWVIYWKEYFFFFFSLQDPRLIHNNV